MIQKSNKIIETILYYSKTDIYKKVINFSSKELFERYIYIR